MITTAREKFVTTTAEDVEVKKPKRIQRKRTKGWTMPPNTIYVGRPSVYGNPFRVGDKLGHTMQPWVYAAAAKLGIARDTPLTGEQVLMLFRAYAEANDGLLLYEMMLRKLRGKDLACWCKEGSPCHADILLELANS